MNAPTGAPSAAKLSAPAVSTEPTHLGDKRINRKKVLVVDDDPVVTQALSLELRSKGYAVVTAKDGSQALCATRQEKPDVMLLDVHFPPDVAHGGGVPWNGFLIAQWLRRLHGTQNTPVILISANDRAEYKQKASEIGAAAFLPKPIDSNLLLASIESAVYRNPKTEYREAVKGSGRDPHPASRNAMENAPALEDAEIRNRERADSPAVEFGL